MASTGIKTVVIVAALTVGRPLLAGTPVSPPFTAERKGRVNDNLTGLICLKNDPSTLFAPPHWTSTTVVGTLNAAWHSDIDNGLEDFDLQ